VAPPQDVQRDLQHTPNCFGPQIIHETDKAGFVVRQAFYVSLYDRISTRPFLSNLEKRWITFQLLSAVAQAYGNVHCNPRPRAVCNRWPWLVPQCGLPGDGGHRHSCGVTHGDIKAENVMLTTWSWLYLTDFATPYKVRGRGQRHNSVAAWRR